MAEEKEPKADVKAEKKGKKEEAEEEAEEEVHEPRAKPKLEPHLKKLLALRSAKNAARPKFRRQEWFRYRKFGDEWRKPQGGQSKLRRHFGYRWNLPSIGYRGPRAVRGLHPSGFQEVLVHNERQLDGLDAAKQAVRIAHAVGSRKGGLNARTPQKTRWIQIIRGMRRHLRELRDQGRIDTAIYRRFYRQAKGGMFKSKSHLDQQLRAAGAIKEAPK